MDGAPADTQSLQAQAAASASKTLGASLGSDSPYLVLSLSLPPSPHSLWVGR